MESTYSKIAITGASPFDYKKAKMILHRITWGAVFIFLWVLRQFRYGEDPYFFINLISRPAEG